MENLIINIIELRYFKSKLNNKRYGDFYVKTKEGDYYVFMNDDEIYLLSHLTDRRADECVQNPTEKFKSEFLSKLEGNIKG